MNITNCISFCFLPLSISQVCDEQWLQAGSSGPQPCETDSQPEPAGGEAGREWAQRVGTRPCEAGLDLQHCTGIIQGFSVGRNDSRSYMPELFHYKIPHRKLYM